MRRHHLFLIIVPFLLSSCLVIHSGSVSSGPLLDRTDQYVDIGIGHASSVFVFGLGDISNDDLVLKAKNNLYLNRPLAKNEYYSNFTTAFTNKIIFLVVHCTKVTVSADLLRPHDTTQGAFSKDFKRLIGSENYFQSAKAVKPGVNENIIIAGDSVYYANNSKDYKLYTVVSVDKENILLNASDAGYKNELVPAKNEFFVKNISINNFKSGKVVSFEEANENGSSIDLEGIVFGVSESKVLVKTKKGFYVLSPSKLTSFIPIKTDERDLMAGDSVYYAASASQYKLFTAMPVDKENVLLKATDLEGKNMLVPIKSNFFFKNIELNGFKSGNLIVFDYEDAYTFPRPMDGLVLGFSEKKVLIKSEKGFFVLPPRKLKKK